MMTLRRDKPSWFQVPLDSVLGTALLRSEDGQNVVVPLASLLTSPLVRSILSDLHPALLQSPLVISCPVSFEVLGTVKEVFSKGLVKVEEECMYHQVKNLLNMMEVTANLSCTPVKEGHVLSPTKCKDVKATCEMIKDSIDRLERIDWVKIKDFGDVETDQQTLPLDLRIINASNSSTKYLDLQLSKDISNDNSVMEMKSVKNLHHRDLKRRVHDHSYSKEKLVRKSKKEKSKVVKNVGVGYCDDSRPVLTSTVGCLADHVTYKGLVTETDEESGNKIWICPACGKQDDGSPMIGCDQCDDWYHWLCVGINAEPSENQDWFCSPCMAKKQDLKGGFFYKKKRGYFNRHAV